MTVDKIQDGGAVEVFTVLERFLVLVWLRAAWCGVELKRGDEC